MKKFLLSNWPLILITVLSGLVTWPLFASGYFSHHDNLQVIRIFEMRKCFDDVQIPCRWVPDMGYGNGYPLFNFYGVLPYYIGALFSFFAGFIGAAKILFFIPLLLGGVAMYFLAKELFGKIPGTVAAVLYLFAPYRALDSYVRGDVGESFALALLPLVFYSFLKLIKSKKRNDFILATLVMFLFLITHNVMILIFTPVIVSWVIFLLMQEKWHGYKLVFLSLVLAFGLSAFFILPAFFEKNLVQTDSLTVGELDFRNQFVKISQLFVDRSWHYSGSNPQSSFTISYQIGWPHWLVAFLGIAIALIVKRKNRALPIFLFGVFIFGVFMTHNKSAPVWELIKILAFVQFPWRFLSFAIFSASLLGGYLMFQLKGKWLIVSSSAIIVLTVLLNWQYFKPEHFYYTLTDKELLSGQSFITQQAGAILDYLPKTATEPRELAPKNPYVVSGNAVITSFVNKSDSWSFDAKVTKAAVIEVPVLYFPNWTVNYPTKLGTIGRIAISLPVGEDKVVGSFKNTPIRTVGNTISILSFIALAILYAKNRKIFI